MAYNRLPSKDPRTIAREMPSIFDILFPQLTGGTVLYLNKSIQPFEKIKALPAELVQASNLQHAMLFEVAYARAEQRLNGLAEADWDVCLEVATQRQKRHFDAILPDVFTKEDLVVADWVGNNLALMLNQKQRENDAHLLTQTPTIQGYQWISSGVGDFSIGTKLIEVKCSGKNFGSADYRQMLMYWLLSYASAIEFNTPEWETCILLNPRLNRVVEIPFDEIVNVTSAGKSKIELLELFSSIVGDYALKVLPEFKL